ncbi:acyltransferase-domain-containing protein [Chytriomyces cf. hyalinus JEL632]|nr:acyltransferase-domain-containing protein [Chytriomyces cf. hyalinus JEL632]
MWRLVVLVLLSIHINILQTPSLLLQMCAWGLNPLGHPATALQRAFVWYNRITQALFCSALVLVLSHKHATEIEIIEMADASSSLSNRSLIIANHQTLLDWMFVWVAAWRMGRHGDLRIVLKDSLQRIPVFGWGMHFFSFIFVARNWAKDEQILMDRCTHLRHTSTSRGGYCLLLFPEGTIISPDTLAKSHAFSEKRGDLYRCGRVLVPRYKALWVCLKQLCLGLNGEKVDSLEGPSSKQQRLQSLVDMTIAYEPAINVKDGIFPEKVFSPRSLFLPDWSAPKNPQNWKIPPQRVQIMFETIDESEWAAFLVDNDETHFDEWLRMRWKRKEDEMESFQESRQLMKEGRKMKRTVFKIAPSVWDIISLALAVLSAWALVSMAYTIVVSFLNT